MSDADSSEANDALRARIATLEAASRAFSAQSEILESFFKHTQTGLVLLDRDFNFIRVNDAYARACQRDASEFPGLNHFELYPSPLIDDFRRVVAEKKAWSSQARPFVFPDHPEWGTTYWDLALVPILDERGEVAHLVFSLHDVTQIIRAEAALRESEARLRQAQKLESIGRLAGGVAHDFNNLLSVINSYTALSLRAVEPSSSLHADLSEVLAAGERAAALTRQLLAFSRHQVLELRAVSLHAILGNMAGMLRRMIGEDIELSVESTPELDPILADPGQIELVVLNLVLNARDAMPRGGQIVIGARNLELASDHHVELSVRDTGQGMDETTCARIFEPFFSTKPAGLGTGLGLATVQGIVQQSNGSIAVHSEPEKGTTFVIRFPRCAANARAAEPPAPQRVETRGSETVLVVEDDDTIRDLLVRVLGAAGYHVLSAANGEDALALVERIPELDLVLSDVVMPRLGGAELVSRLCKRYPGLRSIFISGYVDDATSLSTELDATTHFLAKPLMPDTLLRKIRVVLDAT